MGVKGRGPGGRKLSSAHSAQLDLQPGDEFEISLGKTQDCHLPVGAIDAENRSAARQQIVSQIPPLWRPGSEILAPGRCRTRLEMKPLTRLELVTSPLPRECSTAELQGHVEGGPGWI